MRHKCQDLNLTVKCLLLQLALFILNELHDINLPGSCSGGKGKKYLWVGLKLFCFCLIVFSVHIFDTAHLKSKLQSKVNYEELGHHSM